MDVVENMVDGDTIFDQVDPENRDIFEWRFGRRVFGVWSQRLGKWRGDNAICGHVGQRKSWRKLSRISRGEKN